MNDYPQEFMDWTAEQFGLECVDYQNEQCYGEWCAARRIAAKDPLYLPLYGEE